VIEGFGWDAIGKGFAVVAGGMALMLFLSVRLINNYD
jgi:hypothetical protein